MLTKIFNFSYVLTPTQIRSCGKTSPMRKGQREQRQEKKRKEPRLIFKSISISAKVQSRIRYQEEASERRRWDEVCGRMDEGDGKEGWFWERCQNYEISSTWEGFCTVKGGMPFVRYDVYICERIYASRSSLDLEKKKDLARTSVEKILNVWVKEHETRKFILYVNRRSFIFVTFRCTTKCHRAKEKSFFSPSGIWINFLIKSFQ